MGESASDAASGTRQFLTFRLDSRLYALPAQDVIEVIRKPHAARVPQAPKALIGIANLRGTVLPLTSLRGLLGAPEKPDGGDARAIVLEGAAPAAIVVDAVEALVTIENARVETESAELAAEEGERVKGAFRVEGLGTAKILDIKSLLAAAFARRAEREKRSLPRLAPAAQRADERGNDHIDMLVTFDVAGQEYALELSSVQEIVSAPDMVTPLPRAETLVVGMMSLRDRLLPLLSLRGLLGFEQAARGGREKVVVASVNGALVGLIADGTRAILAAEQSRIDPIPPVLAARASGEAHIKAMYRGEEGKRLIPILATDQLFREDVMRRLGSHESAPAPAAGSETAAAIRQFLVFRLGDDEFGLPIEAVEEVAHVPEGITRVPKTPKFLEGIANLRGDTLPVIDQRRRFDMPKLERAEGRRLIVLRTDRYRAGVIVDSVSEVLRCAADAIEPAPDLTSDIARLVQGVLNLDDQGRIILLLDPAELLTRAERGLLDAFESKAKAP